MAEIRFPLSYKGYDSQNLGYVDKFIDGLKAKLKKLQTSLKPESADKRALLTDLITQFEGSGSTDLLMEYLGVQNNCSKEDYETILSAQISGYRQKAWSENDPTKSN